MADDDRLVAKLDRIENMLATLLKRGAAIPEESRASYTVAEVAAITGRTAYSVREWCRLGRIHASKRVERRGGAELWSIAAQEIMRLRDHGLLPIDPSRNARQFEPRGVRLVGAPV